MKKQKKGLDQFTELIELELNKYSNMEPPSYVEFNHAVSKYFSEESFPLHNLYTHNAGNDIFDFVTSAINLMDQYESKVKDWSRGGKDVNTNEYLNLLNKYKLLFSYFHTDERGKNLYQLLKTGKVNEENSLSIRLDFFKAIENKNSIEAGIKLGSLRESEHDKGELTFLEGLLYFKSNGFEKAIEKFHSVHREHVDYRNARPLLLEAYAYLGDADSIWSILQKENLNYSRAFLSYIGQVVSLQNEQMTLEHPLFAHILEQTNHIDEKDPYTSHFIRHSCEIATRLVERENILAEKMNAVSQTLTDEEILKFHKSNDLIESIDVQLMQALFLHKELYHSVLSSEKSAEVILHTLWMKNNNLLLEDFYEGLKITYRLDKKAFIRQVLKNQKSIQLLIDEEQHEIYSLAYQEAVILQHAMKKELLRRLKRCKFYKETENEAYDVSAYLSPMGKISFRTAEKQFQSALDNKTEILDGGMISLGYFRLIELELNERIVKPLLKSVNMDDVMELVENLEDEKLTSIWIRCISNLEKVQTGKKSGVELGTLNFLFGKLKSSSGKDLQIKELLRHEAAKVIPTVDLSNNYFVEITNNEVRDKYRNPPAHTKFVSFNIAKECRQFVIESLTTLNSIIPYEERGQGQ